VRVLRAARPGGGSAEPVDTAAAGGSSGPDAARATPGDLAMPPSWDPLRVDFDQLAVGPLSPGAYPDATITLAGGAKPYVWSGSYRIADTSEPNRPCLTTYSDCSGADHDLSIAFSNPARKILFDIFGWDSDHPADVELDTDAGTIVVPIMTTAYESGGGPPMHVDLTAQAPAHALRIVNIGDPAGIGIDTLELEVAR
jgi:hypothetical protein